MTSRFLVKQNLRFFWIFLSLHRARGRFCLRKVGRNRLAESRTKLCRNGQSDILWRRQRLKCQTPIPPTPALIQKVID